MRNYIVQSKDEGNHANGGLGVSEVGGAALTEARLIMKVAKGDQHQAAKMLPSKVREVSYINEAQQKSIQQLFDLATTDSTGNKSTAAAYLEARKVHHTMLIDGKAGELALAMASGAMGAFEPVETPNGVIYRE